MDHPMELTIGVISKGETVQTWGVYDGRHEFKLVLPIRLSEKEVLEAILGHINKLNTQSRYQ